ncbi:MAG: TIM barrel protein [Phycisphaeraceae bacterium]
MAHDHDRALAALDRFSIELPSWGFADTGTRFGKFQQDAAASTLDEKLHDAGVVHRLTGACPRVAVHVLWDFDDPSDPASAEKTLELAEGHGVSIGSINPNVFQDQQYKLGSFCSPDPVAREAAMKHTMESIALGAAVGSPALSMWLADGTNYPGQDSLYRRKRSLQSAFREMHEELDDRWPSGTLLIEYKPFEPAFYHTDIADWGMALTFCRYAGERAKVLVDTGHHLPGCNIEHLVAFLLDEGMLGGFHFNDRKYADDDLTLGSIDPYAVFRIFDQIAQFEHDHGLAPGATGEAYEVEGKHLPAVAYMVDQSHNVKPKLEAMVQTVCEAQKRFAQSHLVDRAALADAQGKGDIVAAESLLKSAFEADVSGLLAEWRKARGLSADPLAELRSSGLIDRLARDRAAARVERGDTAASSYA